MKRTERILYRSGTAMSAVLKQYQILSKIS